LGEWIFQYWDEHVKRSKLAPPTERPIEFTAEPGDVVFVPHGWWHLVINLDAINIAITHNYASMSNLSSVLKFLNVLKDQVSGCRDRTDSIKPDELHDEFVKELLKKYPEETKQALADPNWNCNAWKGIASSHEGKKADSVLNDGASLKTSIMGMASKANDENRSFSFSFL
jgi:ribosomal protein L16 Arg81 hydroxylase